MWHFWLKAVAIAQPPHRVLPRQIPYLRKKFQTPYRLPRRSPPGGVDSLLTTTPFAEQRWAEMTDGPVEVALTQIAAADKVCFVPGHPQLLLVEGCPDARNIWTYIVDLKEKTARQFPSTEGILRFSASGDTLILGAYRYHEEGGRYSVAKTYTLAGQFIKEEETEEY